MTVLKDRIATRRNIDSVMEEDDPGNKWSVTVQWPNRMLKLGWL